MSTRRSSSGDDEVLPSWREGVERAVFFPQYHGRSHFWVDAWLRELRRGDAVARDLFAERCHGGPALLRGQAWRYHSEYVEWRTGEQLSGRQAAAWLRRGLAIFEGAFGFPPQSSVAPHYVLTPAAERAWAREGIRFVQGAGYRILRGVDGEREVVAHLLGERSADGLHYLARFVKFEPGRGRKRWGAAAASKRIKDCFASRIPAVLDTHRINYTGRFRERGLAGLEALLASLRDDRPLFLTTVELGQAIANAGLYTDRSTGADCRLTPLDSFPTSRLRSLFARSHSRRIARLAPPR